MILVTLGTQNQKFYRLLDALENSNIKDKIIVQAGGSSDYKSKKMQILKFVDYRVMEKYIKDADIIITHGGTGSIIMPLQQNKKVIACARLAKYGEHINDHQLELVSIFAEEGYIKEFKDGDNIDDIIKECKSFKPKKYISNTNNFIRELKNIIDN
jgi:UDP-N-acetylglucosamine transferase subunit ALG13